MKKMIAVFVVLALFAGSAFAQTNATVFGNVEARGNFLSGDNREFEGIVFGDGRVQTVGTETRYTALPGFEFANNYGVRMFSGAAIRGNIGVNINRDTDVGRFEGAVRVGMAADAAMGGDATSAVLNRAWIGWRPNDMINIRFGRDHWTLDDLGRQAFMMDAAGVGVGGLGAGAVFFPGSDGLVFNVRPLADMALDIGFGFMMPSAALATPTSSPGFFSANFDDNGDFMTTAAGDPIYTAGSRQTWNAAAWRTHLGYTEAQWNAMFPGNAVSEVLGRIRARARLDMPGLGTFGLGYVGGGSELLGGTLAGDAANRHYAQGITRVTGFADPSVDPGWGNQPDTDWGTSVTATGLIPYWNLGSIYAMGRVTAVENLSAELGVRFDLGHQMMENRNYIAPTAADEKPIARNTSALHIGLGANYQVMPEFGVRFRGFAHIRFEDNSPNQIGFDILPFYDVSGTVRVALLAGLRMTMFDWNTTEGTVSAPQPTFIPVAQRVEDGLEWEVHPFVRINTGGPTFLAGVRIQGTNLRGAVTDEALVHINPWMPNVTNVNRDNNHRVRRAANETFVQWSVPIGMTFSF